MTEPGDAQATTFAYNQDGARTQIRYPSGVTVNTAYDTPSGRILSVINRGPSGGVLKSFAYTYQAPDGRDTELIQTETDQTGARTTNSYDRLDRLTDSVTASGRIATGFHYTLDGEGNRISERSGPEEDPPTDSNTKTWAYDSANLPCWRAKGSWPSSCATPPPPGYYLLFEHDANGSDLNNLHQFFTYNAANQATSVAVRTLGSLPQRLAYRGPGQSKLIQDGTYTLQHNLLGIGTRGASHYARATDGTLLSQRPPEAPQTSQSANSDSPRRNYLYDGEGSIVGLTDNTGTLQTSYSYDPYGHPPNTTSLGDPNPFGYHGAYSAGIEAAGVICGGPNQFDDAYYDPEDGRFTQLPYLVDYYDEDQGAPGLHIPGAPDTQLPSGPEIFDRLDDINDIAGDAQRFYNEYIRGPLNTKGGRVVRNCIAGGGPLGLAARLANGPVTGAFVLGCATVNVVRRGR